MNSHDADARLSALLQEVDLPERAYELAEHRYEDIAEWIARPESGLVAHDAHVFVQGSFAFGTAIRPVNDEEEYDLDFTCKLRNGVSRDTHTQRQLKELVGRELESYRRARQIQKQLDEKDRCWRLGYRDELPFHMDVVPGIKADDLSRRALRVRMEQGGVEATVAQEAARRALWITDRQHPAFTHLDRDWPSSNPGGYQLWFVSRMRTVAKGMLAEAQVDPMPIYRSKTALQQVVQLLKRHRDVMFRNAPKSKPASIILTTVAGLAYSAGDSLSQTMQRVLQALDRIRVSNTDEIRNPVEPLENFADRWKRPDCVHLHLKHNFHEWIREANRDFAEIMGDATGGRIREIAKDALAIALNDATARRLGIPIAASVATVRTVTASDRPPSPWAC